jgi:hypothetical protein
MSRPHQPGEAMFRSVLPEDIDWTPFAAFPPSARLAVEYVTQVTALGPLGLDYIDPKDDPRNG